MESHQSTTLMKSLKSPLNPFAKPFSPSKNQKRSELPFYESLPNPTNDLVSIRPGQVKRKSILSPQASSPKSASVYFNRYDKKLRVTKKCPTIHCNCLGNINNKNAQHYSEKNCPNRLTKIDNGEENEIDEDLTKKVHNAYHLTNDAFMFLQELLTTEKKLKVHLRFEIFIYDNLRI